ncbi:MAG: hypothetical protein LUG12_09660 [Erysipelotrichaceae bacterium]|nr:hypothetical protein [Erysipelotrichaceae bacterium]
MKKYYVISAKRLGWEQKYDYYVFPTNKFSEKEVLALFRPVKKRTLKANNNFYDYTAYEYNGITYYKIINSGIFDENHLLADGFTKEELDQF